MQVLFWVQHLLGTGHLKRAATLAEAMAGLELEVTLASGGAPAPWLVPSGVRLVQLPALQSDPAFSSLTDAQGRPADEGLWTARRVRLLALLDELRPHVLITEMFPFGRRAFGRELIPLLDAAAALRPRPRRLTSVRDILVRKSDPGRTAWMRDVALTHYDLVLVHTDPRVVPFELTFPHADALAGRIVTTGYVAPPAPAQRPGPGSGEVLVSAGGGRVGEALIEAALGARAFSRRAQGPWRLIAGEGMADAVLAGMRARLPDGVILERQRADFQVLLANSLLSVSQAGYNTVVEALRLGKPMVLVPFETATETEQRVRAERLAELGLAKNVWQSALRPQSLARAVDAALDAGLPAAATIDLDGARASARLVRAQALGVEPGP